MKYRIITLIGLAGSTLAVCFGGWDKFLQTLLLFMAIDWFTGGILLPAVFGKSPKSENGALESRAGQKGLCRKGMTLLYVLIAARLEALMGTEYLRDNDKASREIYRLGRFINSRKYFLFFSPAAKCIQARRFRQIQC